MTRSLASASTVLAAVAALVSGCTPSIGDKCSTANDCGIKGDRVCDTSQPGGYCTQTGCSRGTCPKHAACILFNTRVPGCGYNDRVVSRFANTACMAVCGKDSDCRDGYVCRNPAIAPWMAFTMEDVTQSVCIAQPPAAILAVSDADSTAPICGPGVGFDVGTDDAGATSDAGEADAGLTTGGADSGLDAAADAG